MYLMSRDNYALRFDQINQFLHHYRPAQEQEFLRKIYREEPRIDGRTLRKGGNDLLNESEFSTALELKGPACRDGIIINPSSVELMYVFPHSETADNGIYAAKFEPHNPPQYYPYSRYISDPPYHPPFVINSKGDICQSVDQRLVAARKFYRFVNQMINLGDLKTDGFFDKKNLYHTSRNLINPVTNPQDIRYLILELQDIVQSGDLNFDRVLKGCAEQLLKDLITTSEQN